MGMSRGRGKPLGFKSLLLRLVVFPALLEDVNLGDSRLLMYTLLRDTGEDRPDRS